MYNGKMRIAIVLVLSNFVAFSSCAVDPEADITLAVGSSSAPPGSNTIAVDVAMDNGVLVKGIQLDICDEGNYLISSECETTARAAGFACLTNELRYGCVRIIMYSLEGDLIDVGAGPLFSINYDVIDEAPLAECINLTIVEAKISDENTNPLNATTEQGKFCIE